VADLCPESFSCNHGFCTRGPVCLGDSGDAGEDAFKFDQMTDGDTHDLLSPEADADPESNDGNDGKESDADGSDANPGSDLIGDDGDVQTGDAAEAGPDVSMPFLPSNLSGLVLWLAPDYGITSSPFRWADRSPQHNDAEAPEQAPTVMEVGSGKPPMVQFDGKAAPLGQYLRLPDGMSLWPPCRWLLEIQMTWTIPFASLISLRNTAR